MELERPSGTFNIGGVKSQIQFGTDTNFLVFKDNDGTLCIYEMTESGILKRPGARNIKVINGAPVTIYPFPPSYSNSLAHTPRSPKSYPPPHYNNIIPYAGNNTTGIHNTNNNAPPHYNGSFPPKQGGFLYINKKYKTKQNKQSKKQSKKQTKNKNIRK